MTLVSGNINHYFVDIRRRFSEIDEFAVFPFHIFVYVSEITSALIAHYDNTPFF